MSSIELSKEQSRKVTVDHIAHTLIIMKQYLSAEQLEKYQFTLFEFGNLSELDEIAERFDRAWPTDVTWTNIR